MQNAVFLVLVSLAASRATNLPASRAKSGSKVQVSVYNGSVPFAGATLVGGGQLGLDPRGPGGECTPNEIYIVDGDKTVVLTNKAISADIEYVQQETINLKTQINNQNEIISNLKKQLSDCQREKQDTTRMSELREVQHSALIKQLNKTMEAVDKMVKENQGLVADRNKERDGRIHFESENKKLIFKMHEMSDEFNRLSEAAKTDRNSKFLFDQCELKLKAKSAIIESYRFHDTANPEQQDCQANNLSSECSGIRQELLLQDQTINLLKGQIKDQAMALRSVNQLLLAKHNMMINVTERLHARLNQSALNRGEIDNFESFLNTQQEVIRLLGTIGSYNTYLRDARDTALKILQETVYKMVGGIDECRDAVVEGLKRRLHAIEDRDQPLQNMIKSLRETLDKAEVLKNVRDQHEHRIDEILDTRRQVLDFVTRWQSDVADFSKLADRLKCDVNTELIQKLDTLYKPVNTITCQPICQNNRV